MPRDLRLCVRGHRRTAAAIRSRATDGVEPALVALALDVAKVGVQKAELLEVGPTGR